MICCTVVSDHTQQISIFCDNFLLILQHLLMRYVLNHCDHVADMVRIEPFSWRYHMDLGFAIHKATLSKHEAIKYFFYFNSAPFQFCWIWCGKLANGPNKAKNGPELAQYSQFSASNSAKLERNGGKIKQYLNCFKFQQSGFVYSKT